MGAQRLDYVPTEAELAYIRKSFEDCSAFITICAGFQSGLQAGIFQGKTAAAPRLMLDQLREMAPTTNWVEKRWQRDGKLWTSGALLNGLDLMRAFATEYWGGEGSLIEFAIEFGHYPKRDVDYADAPTKL
jgi:transcriptional regulator GlxA family with amidase domain